MCRQRLSVIYSVPNIFQPKGKNVHVQLSTDIAKKNKTKKQ